MLVVVSLNVCVCVWMQTATEAWALTQFLPLGGDLGSSCLQH